MLGHNAGVHRMIVEATTPPPSKPKRRSIPYPHQVGGHGQLRQLTAGRILKPVYEKELNFYNYIYSSSLPEHLRWLRNVTPAFFGERALSISDSSSDEDCELEHHPYMSPWAITMGRRIKKKKSKTLPGHAICLEDLNYAFHRPCVLDVKVGRRHYDDDATQEKRRRHIEKSKNTTSLEYGVRFTGMQCFKIDCEEGRYAFRDKYHGRRLKGQDLGPELTWFFHNTSRLRAECIVIILDKLRRIYRRLEEQKHFKFYSSSILLMYEGDPNAPVRADLRMIDFAHTQWINESDGDPGYLFGIHTLIRLLEEILEKCNNNNNNNHHQDVDLKFVPTDIEPTSV